MSSVQKDFYGILGVNNRAEFAVIKAAYKALIMIYHPDRYIGDKYKAVKKSKDINEAYAVLIDPDKRKKYDAERLGKPENRQDNSEFTLNVLNELNKTLAESEAILKILDEPENTFSPFNGPYDLKSLLVETEAILNILNEPD